MNLLWAIPFEILMGWIKVFVQPTPLIFFFRPSFFSAIPYTYIFQDPFMHIFFFGGGDLPYRFYFFTDLSGSIFSTLVLIHDGFLYIGVCPFVCPSLPPSELVGASKICLDVQNLPGASKIRGGASKNRSEVILPFFTGLGLLCYQLHFYTLRIILRKQGESTNQQGAF